MAAITAHEQASVDLLQARKNSSVTVVQLRTFIYGGDEEWKQHCNVSEAMSVDPVFDKSRRPYMTRKERYKNVLRMIHRVYELKDKLDWSQAEFRKGMRLVDETNPFDLHLIAFEPVLRTQAAPELLQRYEKLVEHAGIIGCYLQTELAHGSNLTSLETTATYIVETKEFELHTPTFTASKWWVGAAGKLATHGVVQAQLILPGGRNVGPHLFFVQLRSLDDHRHLPGITLGDIGSKALGGWSTTDNGYARFNHVRIPVWHMLSKFAQVTDDGEYVKPLHAKISYGGMMYIRSSMIMQAGWTLAKGITIAIRYAHARRQGNKGTDGLEKQIITYASVHNRLLPLLARAYTWILLGRNLEKAFAEMTSRLATGDTSLLAEMHATTSGLKSLVSTCTVEDLEAARRCLGGHGFSEAAGIGRIYAFYLPNVTFEGDNFVLDYQVVRSALKAFKQMTSTKTASRSAFSPFTRFLRHTLESGRRLGSNGTVFWHDPHTAVELLELRALYAVRHHAAHESDPDASAAQRVAKAVTEAFVAAQVEQYISDLAGQLPGQEAHVVSDLLLLYLLTTLEHALVDLLSFNLLPPSFSDSNGLTHMDCTRSVRKAVQEQYHKLLPQAVGLTDAFGFSDWELDSALGVHDGKVYEALWDRAQREPLNESEVVDGYDEYIKPVLLRGRRLANQQAKL